VSTPGLWADDIVDDRVRTTHLRSWLRANAALSIVTGAVAAVAASRVDRVVGLGHPRVVPLIGAALAAYGVELLLVAATRRSRLLRIAPWIVFADIAWVVATVVGLATGAVDGAGAAVLVALAVPVAGLALAQRRALASARASAAVIDERPPIEAVRVERKSAARPDALWTAVADHELFGRLAANLDRVEVVSGAGEGMERRCVARGGRAWSERCTLWDDGRRHAVEVDTDGYPYPLALVGCLSYVDDSGGDHHRVGLLFQFQARPGLRGQLAVLALHLGRPVLVRIVRGWAAAAHEPAEARA
jgi:hypothetical protein